MKKFVFFVLFFFIIIYPLFFINHTSSVSAQSPTIAIGNGDANSDGKVDAKDILTEILNYGKTNQTLPLDQYGDGLINMVDVGEVIYRIFAPAATPTPTNAPTPTTITPPPANTYSIGAPDSKLFYGSFEGFGAEFDPFVWNPNVNPGVTQADWNLITGRIQEMQLPFVRIWIQLYWMLKSADLTQWDYNNARMQSVYKYLDFACQNNIDVILNDWNWSFWPSYGFYNGNSADSRYTQGIADYLKYLIQTKGYSCIKYFILGNESDNEFIGSGKSFNDFVIMQQNMDQALRNDGIRDQIKFIGPDPACCSGLYTQTLQSSLHSTFDGYDVHIYQDPSLIASGDLWWRIEQYRDDYTRNYSPDPATDMSKPHFVTEAGRTTGVSDAFDGALDMADYGTIALSTKVQGVSEWNMFDEYYDQEHSDTESHTTIPWGLWKYKDSNWSLRPWSHTWGLLVRFAPKGSIRAPVVYPGQSKATPNTDTDSGHPPTGSLRLAALKRPDGKWSIFIVNRNSSATTITIRLPDSSTHQFTKYLATSSKISNLQSQIIPSPESGLVTITSSVSISLDPSSFTVLVE